MATQFQKIRLSFSAKILIPVLTLLVLLPGVMLYITHRSSLQQLEREARHQLRTADAVFQNSLLLRSRQLVARYKDVANDVTFGAVALLKHAPTMNSELHSRLENDPDAEVMLFIDAHGQSFATAARNNAVRMIEFEKGAAGAIQQALGGHPNSIVLPVGSALFNAIAVPVLVKQELTGILLVAVPVGLNTLKELTTVFGGEGVFVANSNVAASTLHKTEIHASALPHWTSGAASGVAISPVLLDRQHYLALASRFPGVPTDADLGYVLLLSYESALQELRQMQASLWIISLIGLAISTIVIWIVIGKVTAPLKELRAITEAVGSGDFTKKAHVTSTDELGQFAQAFNHMTKNLRASHSELQRTVQTLKATQAQLIQSEKLSAVGEFVAGVAHELNNPLTSVVGFAELLKEAELQPKHRSYLQYIVKSTERCHRIVQGLLSFARQHPAERVLLDVNEMISGILEILAYEMRTSNIEVQREFQPELPKLFGDSHQLQQAILNILNNARQAIETHQSTGRIRISTESNGEHVRIIIEDNGPGINAENLNKIFDPFFTTKPIGKGTGLGLSLCYGIIREHGGNISAHSLPGKGATFIIELPVHKDKTSTAVSRHPVGGESLEGAGRRVLVIDDEEWILELVRHILKEDGFEVDVAMDGEKALEQVAGGGYELLVCDWKMPGLSGPQLYQKIAERNPDAARRLMFMTGDVAGDGFQQFLRQHCTTCLSKPFSVTELRHSVSRFLSERQASPLAAAAQN